MRRLCPIGALVAISLLPLAAHAQAPATGRMLVATESLIDPNFSATVVLLLHHGEDGSLGIFVDRPTWVHADEAFPELQGLANYKGVLYHGGPVSQTQLLILGKHAPDPDIESTEVLDGVFLSADLTVLDDDSGDPADEIRIYAGHAAWAPGQLEDEIARGSWRVIDGSAGYVFAAKPLELWHALTGAPAADLTVAQR